MERIQKYALLVVGILVGSAHLWLAVKAMFVFRNNEPASMWIFIVAGPLSTLPAVVAAFFWPRFGGTWLVLGSLLSFAADLSGMLGSGVNLQQLMWSFTAYSAPMLVLGIATLLQASKR